MGPTSVLPFIAQLQLKATVAAGENVMRAKTAVFPPASLQQVQLLASVS